MFGLLANFSAVNRMTQWRLRGGDGCRHLYYLSTMYRVQCTVHTVQSTMYTVQGTEYTVKSRVYIVQGVKTVYTVQNAAYTACSIVQCTVNCELKLLFKEMCCPNLSNFEWWQMPRVGIITCL